MPNKIEQVLLECCFVPSPTWTEGWLLKSLDFPPPPVLSGSAEVFKQQITSPQCIIRLLDLSHNLINWTLWDGLC